MKGFLKNYKAYVAATVPILALVAPTEHLASVAHVANTTVEVATVVAGAVGAVIAARAVPPRK